MAFKIVKTADAPDGEVKVSIANESFVVGDGASHETDDAALAEQVRSLYPEVLAVEVVDEALTNENAPAPEVAADTDADDDFSDYTEGGN